MSVRLEIHTRKHVTIKKVTELSLILRHLLHVTPQFLCQNYHHSHSNMTIDHMDNTGGGIARAERDGTRAETRLRLSPKRTSPFKSVGASVQSTAGSRGVRISLSNAGYTTFRDGVRVLATHSIRQFPLHFPSRASPCTTRFRTSSNRGKRVSQKV